MKISRQPAVYWAFCESDFEMRGAKTHLDGRNMAPPASIIKAIGDPTTAEIVRLYEKYCERAEAKRSCEFPNLRNQATGSPLLTIFITDLQFPQPWKELLRLIRLYLCSRNPVVMVLGEPHGINRIHLPLFQDPLRRYRLSATEIDRMYSDIGLINQTIYRAQNMPCLTLRGWNWTATLGYGMKRGGCRLIRMLCGKTASLSTCAFVNLRKAILSFGH